MKHSNPYIIRGARNTKSKTPILKFNKLAWFSTPWSRTSLIIFSSVALVVGIGLINLGWATNPFIVTSSILLLPLVFLPTRLGGLVLILLFLNLGLIRGSSFAVNLAHFDRLYNQEVLMIGTVSDDPTITNARQTEFHAEKLILLENDSNVNLPGRIKIRGFPSEKLSRGHIVEVGGKLRKALGNRQGQVSYAQIKLLARSKNAVDTVRQEFVAGTYSALPEPQASLGLGFLIGTRSLLPVSLTAPMAALGLTHIVAVSGYNLTILVRFTRRFLGKISKYFSLVGSLGLITGFVAITGLSPSVVRAAFVSVFALLAWYYGRQVKPLVLLFLPAAITAYINPTYVWYDVGWYLSFLAFFGVLIIAPLIYGRIYKSRKIPTLGQILVETSCALIMTLPLIMYIFGHVSPFALLANMIVLPMVPLAMLTTFIAGIAGFFIPSVAGWLAWPASTILKLITDLISWLGSFPGVQVDFRIGLIHMLGLYLSILAVVIILSIKNNSNTLKEYSVVE